MKKMLLCICVAPFVTCCNVIPQLAQSAEDIANDDVLSIEIDKGAIVNSTDIDIDVRIRNQEQK